MQGFRCFDAEEWHHLPLTQETIIMGPNNSGKSALLSVVDFYRASFRDFPSASYTLSSEIHRWGNPKDFLHPSQLAVQQSGTANPEVDFELDVEAESLCSIQVSWSNSWNNQINWTGQRDEVGVQRTLRQIWHLHPVRPEFPTSQHVGSGGGNQFQPLSPDGTNAIQFLLERWTSRDPMWPEAEDWYKRIDPHMELFTVPLRGDLASIETERRYGISSGKVNISYQGTGLQSVCSVVAALVYSPRGSTVIIEEPEAYLHPRSQEVVVDLMNKAVNEWDKQVIATTHSWDIVLPFVSDIGEGKNRGKQHVKADPEKFSLVTIDDDHNIEEYELAGKKYASVRSDMKKLWG